MPTFTKYLTSKRGAQQLLDSDGYIYSHKKDKDTALSSAWRCCKYGPPFATARNMQTLAEYTLSLIHI